MALGVICSMNGQFCRHLSATRQAGLTHCLQASATCVNPAGKYATSGAAGMIAKVKKTALGRAIYKLSRSRLGTPLQILSRTVQHKALKLEHLQSAHRSHNQKQLDILARFEAQIAPSQPGKVPRSSEQNT